MHRMGSGQLRRVRRTALAASATVPVMMFLYWIDSGATSHNNNDSNTDNDHERQKQSPNDDQGFTDHLRDGPYTCGQTR
jgi:hypothetical protein